jgi:protein-tyrosine phosphatase
MTAFYSNTTPLAARYKPFFSKLLILPDTAALVFHCTAGKDRTGIGAALLLYALGVPYPTIEQDYLATDYYRMKENGKSMEMMVSKYHINEKVARDMMSAKAQYLAATFDAIRRQYGSVDRYLEEELGLNAAKRQQLREKFLTN